MLRSDGLVEYCYEINGVPIYRSDLDGEELCDFNEIRSRDWGCGVTFIEEEFLPLAHHAEIAVVQEHNFYSRTFLHDRGKFCLRHLETAVTINQPDIFFFIRKPCTQSSGDTVSHCAGTTRSEKSERFLKFIVLRRPHLVLTNAGHDQRITFGGSPQSTDCVCRVELAIITPRHDIAFFGFFFPFINL